MKTPITKKRLALLPLLMAAAIVLDQITKTLIVHYLPLGEPARDFLGFRLHHTRNTGAAFSILREHPQLLAIAVGVVLLGCVIWLFAELKRPYAQSVCLALICAGGLGNLIDRIRFGYVIDFIEPVFMRFAIFNVADMVLTCAVVVWFFLLIREAWLERRVGIKNEK